MDYNQTRLKFLGNEFYHQIYNGQHQRQYSTSCTCCRALGADNSPGVAVSEVGFPLCVGLSKCVLPPHSWVYTLQQNLHTESNTKHKAFWYKFGHCVYFSCRNSLETSTYFTLAAAASADTQSSSSPSSVVSVWRSSSGLDLFSGGYFGLT